MNELTNRTVPVDAYRETIDYLFGLQKHGVKLELANSVRLMAIMGDPHRKFQSIHVTGTNGKGSTSAFLASMLEAAGLRVGLYTSPHLVSFTERIRINGVPISEAKVVELARRVREGYSTPAPEPVGETMNPTFFEVTTAVVFTYFAEERVDIAVIETGMGGRLDSTNVITPVVSVITNIDIEHTQYLGDTLELIAGEKAGIIKSQVPVVTGVVQEEAFAVIEREAGRKRARVYRLGRDFDCSNIVLGPSTTFDFQGLQHASRNLLIRLIGRHQVDNACLALGVIERLRDAGIVVDETAVRSGLDAARWPGRMELVSRGPDIYLDGAHNPASARKLADVVRETMLTHNKLILVIGVLSDKDMQGIVRELAPLADQVVATKPEYARALGPDALAGEIRTMHGSVLTAETVSGAIEMARSMVDAEDMILVTGSLYVVGEARGLFFPEAAGAGSLKGITG